MTKEKDIQYKQREKELFEQFCSRGKTGLTNVEMTKMVGHRFGSTIFALKKEGHCFKLTNEQGGVVRYVYTETKKKEAKSPAIDILKEEMRNSGGTIGIKKLEEILFQHGLNVVYRPNQRN